MTHPSTPALTLTLSLFLLAIAGSCKIGNDLGGTCHAGDTCVCDLIGNCSKDCPDGDCHFDCRGTSNCTFTCAGGGCDLVCENTGNCILDCSGGGCNLTCHNTGTCLEEGAMDLSVPPPHDFAQSTHD
jgi:hypothetical protein